MQSRNYYEVVRLSHFSVLVVGAAVAVQQIPGCSWDYPVWPKSKKSDTPLFRFVVNERYGAGYIDRRGRIVIRPQFMSLGEHGADFFEGMAQVAVKSGSTYIDAKGNRVPSSRAGHFSDGLASFQDGNKYGFKDHAGKIVIPAKFDLAEDFSEGMAVVRLNGRYGYVDRSGKMAIPARFDHAFDFADRHALVIENGPCETFGYGPCERMNPYAVPDAPASAYLPLPTQRCHYSVIDSSGRVVIPAMYIDAKPFAEGLAPMADGTKWGYVDYSGRTAIPFQFEAAEPFSEGLAVVRIRGKAGFIDKEGRMAIPPQYSSAESFSEGLAVVVDENGLYIYIDKKGQRAIPGYFTAASSFVMGLGHVRVYDSAKWSWIDRTGKAVFTYFDQSGQR